MDFNFMEAQFCFWCHIKITTNVLCMHIRSMVTVVHHWQAAGVGLLCTGVSKNMECLNSALEAICRPRYCGYVHLCSEVSLCVLYCFFEPSMVKPYLPWWKLMVGWLFKGGLQLQKYCKMWNICELSNW